MLGHIAGVHGCFALRCFCRKQTASLRSPQCLVIGYRRRAMPKKAHRRRIEIEVKNLVSMKNSGKRKSRKAVSTGSAGSQGTSCRPETSVFPSTEVWISPKRRQRRMKRGGNRGSVPPVATNGSERRLTQRCKPFLPFDKTKGRNGFTSAPRQHRSTTPRRWRAACRPRR